jgi:anti-sigma factor RsiW
MSCEEMDGLLARYTAGDLTDEEEFVVRVHLSACVECRKSLEIYESLESALDARSKERPSSRRASRAIMRRLRRDEPYAFVSSLWGAPVIIGAVVALSIILTVVFGLVGGPSSVPQGIPGLTGWERYITGIPEWISGTLGGETWLIFLVYSAVAAGFILSGSLVMLRFARVSR